MGAAEKYVLGELNEEDRSRYEEHFFACGECAEDVEGAAVFVANAKKVLAEDTEDTKERVDVRASEAPRAGWLALFWPMPAGALAALFLFVGVAGYQAVFLLPDLRRELAQAEAPQPAPWYFLSVSRSEPQVVKVSRATRMVGLTLSKSSDRIFPFYRCEVHAPGGRLVSSAVVPGPGPRGELEILIPVSGMEPGDYVVHLAGLESASRAEASDPARYPFSIQMTEE